MLVLGPLRLILAHFDTRAIAKADLDHFMTFSETPTPKFLGTAKAYFRRACEHVDVGTCPHQVLAATLTLNAEIHILQYIQMKSR